jgi:hypothetical protein
MHKLLASTVMLAVATASAAVWSVSPQDSFAGSTNQTPTLTTPLATPTRGSPTPACIDPNPLTDGQIRLRASGVYPQNEYFATTGEVCGGQSETWYFYTLGFSETIARDLGIRFRTSSGEARAVLSSADRSIPINSEIEYRSPYTPDIPRVRVDLTITGTGAELAEYEFEVCRAAIIAIDNGGFAPCVFGSATPEMLRPTAPTPPVELATPVECVTPTATPAYTCPTSTGLPLTGGGSNSPSDAFRIFLFAAAIASVFLGVAAAAFRAAPKR